MKRHSLSRVYCSVARVFLAFSASACFTGCLYYTVIDKALHHGSYRFDDLLFKDFSRTFQGLSTIFKESISTRTISHFSSYSKKAISVSANNVIQPKDRIMKNYSFSFSSMELNFVRTLCIGTRHHWQQESNETSVRAREPVLADTARSSNENHHGWTTTRNDKTWQ